MSKECCVTKKTSQMGGSYSNNVRATKFNPCGKRRRYANLQKKTLFIPEIGKKLKLILSTRAIKTINKHGAYSVLKKAGVIK